MLDPDRDLRFVPVAGDPTVYLSFLCVQHCACVFLKSALFSVLYSFTLEAFQSRPRVEINARSERRRRRSGMVCSTEEARKVWPMNLCRLK